MLDVLSTALGGKDFDQIQQIIGAMPAKDLDQAAVGAMNSLPAESRSELGSAMLGYLTGSGNTSSFNNILGSLVSNGMASAPAPAEVTVPQGMGPVVQKAIAAGLPAVLAAGMANGQGGALGNLMTGTLQNGGLNSLTSLFGSAPQSGTGNPMADAMLGGVTALLGQSEETKKFAEILHNPLALKVVGVLLPAILKMATSK